MPAYSAKEQAQEQGNFAELYTMTANGQSWLYTSFERDVDYSGNTYAKAPIRRGDFTIERGNVIRVTVAAPVVNPLLQYLTLSPVTPILIQIRKVFLDDMSVSWIQFSGKVVAIGSKDNILQVDCASKRNDLSRPFPRLIYQSFCNNELFDNFCKVNSFGYMVIPSGLTVNGAKLYSATFDAHADGWFAGGYVQFGNDYRTITKHLSTCLELHVGFGDELVNGSTVYVFPGCDKNPATCKSKFANLNNFLGMPYIPNKNPVIWGVR